MPLARLSLKLLATLNDLVILSDLASCEAKLLASGEAKGLGHFQGFASCEASFWRSYIFLDSGEARLLFLVKLNDLVIFLSFASCEAKPLASCKAKPLASGEARGVPLARLYS